MAVYGSYKSGKPLGLWDHLGMRFEHDGLDFHLKVRGFTVSQGLLLTWVHSHHNELTMNMEVFPTL